MASLDDDPIWYASYGSNCLSARFEAYLAGGRASGSSRSERGARDPRRPVESAPFWIPHGVRFIGASTKWGGGGVAFLDHRRERCAPGRIYLITRGQFDDLAAQESRRDRVALPFDDLIPGEVHVVGSCWYDGLLALEPIEDVPVVTFTSPQPPEDRPTSPPSATYLGTVMRGIMEVHSITGEELADHVFNTPGVAAGWSLAEILRLTKK